MVKGRDKVGIKEVRPAGLPPFVGFLGVHSTPYLIGARGYRA